MVRTPPAVCEHHLTKGFPRLEGCVLFNDARIPQPIAPPIAAEVNAFCMAALLLTLSPDVERDVKAFKSTIELLAGCEWRLPRPELWLTKGFSLSTENVRAAAKLLSALDEFRDEVDQCLNRVAASSDIDARLNRLERIAEETLVLVRRTAAVVGGNVPKSVPLDEARCYSSICAAGETCYAPRCPRGRAQPKQPRAANSP